MISNKAPTITADQMLLVDQLAVEKYNLKLIQMMENAGRALAELARRKLLQGELLGKKILVLAGPGGNGGGGMVAARRLHNWGAEVILGLWQPPDGLGSVPQHQYRMLKAYGVKTIGPDDPWPESTHLIIDALFGYSLRGSPRPPYDKAIEKANQTNSPILALDLPSGLHPDTGQPLHPTIHARATLTLALPKQGLVQPPSGEYVGDLWLADISIPNILYQEIGLEVPTDLFATSDLIRLAS